MPLTDVKVRQAKAGDKPLKLADSHGLYLEVKPNGSK
ncbi:MAG: Arm DNA-binding domain-containing protein, partial [Thiobacillaceae bacterium]